MTEDIIVFCDKPTDVKLFNLLKRLSPILAKIKDSNVKVLPNRKSLPGRYGGGFGHLLDYDRADYYFCYDSRPFFVIEMTEHGYTGDQCMQRFARIAKTAEMGVPFVYFAPLSRTRYDELDSDTPSSRNVSADMYKGFVRLTELFNTPVIAVPWAVGENGIPLILGRDDPERTGIAELFRLIDGLFANHFAELISGQSILAAKELRPYLELTKRLSLRKNVRESDVRKEQLTFQEIADVIRAPQNTYRLMPKTYFYKGKSVKLLAKMCIDCADIRTVILPDGSELPVEQFLEKAGHVFRKTHWLYFYSGYQWRSEPNVGVVTNIDIIKCRSGNGKTIYDRDQLLCVHWPRIFWDKDSPARAAMQRALAAPKSPELERLAEEAYHATGKMPNIGIIRNSPRVFGVWSDRATVARIYRDVCDLIILNDALIVGNKWGGCFED